MDRKKYSENKDDLSQSSQVVSAIDAFTSSDYLVGNSMDNIEGMLRLLMNNPHNLTILKYPTDTMQRTQIVKSIAPVAGKFQRPAASVIRGFSAESVMRTNRQFMQNSMQDLKSSENIEPQLGSSSSGTPYASISGPVRVQTIQKIDGRSMDKLFIDEILELYGSGVKYPSKELITIKPKILKSPPTTTKNTPITVQSVRVGRNYVRIDRKMILERSKIESPQVAMNTKEVIKFDNDGLIQEKQKMKPSHRKSKSEAILLKTPVFNLIGPLVITAFQNTVHDTKGNYTIYEEIELRADGSTAKPETTVIPFLRKKSVLPKNEKQQIPTKYQEDILVGYNVMLIKRLIEIKPFFQKQVHDFSLSEERNYVTDKSIRTASTESITSNIGERPKMLVLQEPSVKTDLTALSSSSAELEGSVYKSDQNGKMKGILATARSSSETNNEGHRIVKKFDKFQIIRHPAPINGPKIGKISNRKHHKSKVSTTPTEAFINAELRTARLSRNVSKMKDFEREDYALQAHSDSPRTGISFSSEQVKLQKGGKYSSKSTTKAELSTARSIVIPGKPIFIEDERTRSKESSFSVLTKKPILSEAIGSNSKIQRIYHHTSSPMIRKTIRSSSRFRPIYSPIIYPPTPPRSPRKKKHKRLLGSPQEDQIITAIPPEGFSSRSDSTYTYENDSSMDEEENVSRSIEEASSAGFTSRDQTIKSNESSRLFGTIKSSYKNVEKKPFSDPTKSRLSEVGKQTLTAKTSNTFSSKKDRQQRFSEIPKKFSNIRSTEISSPKILSDIQKFHDSPYVSKQEPKNLKVCLAEVLLEPKKKSIYTISEKDRLLSEKRKFGLLPPTPSIISTSSQRPSTNGSKENIASQSAISKEVSLETGKKVHVASKAIRSRFDRFPMQARSGHKKSLGSITRSRTKRRPSLMTPTRVSDDTKSSDEREPSKWSETDLFMDQSESGSRMQTSHFVIPVSSDASKSISLNVPIVRQTSALKPSMTKTALSTIPDTSAKERSEANLTKGTSLTIQSKEGNLTIQLNINFQIKDEKDKSDDKKHNFKLERILVKGREVYRKNDTDQS